jgi:hypothetical protein
VVTLAWPGVRRNGELTEHRSGGNDGLKHDGDDGSPGRFPRQTTTTE